MNRPTFCHRLTSWLTLAAVFCLAIVPVAAQQPAAPPAEASAPAVAAAPTTAGAVQAGPAGRRGGRGPTVATPRPTPTPSPEDLTTTMTLQLKNQNIEQLVKFLTETTGKPIIYQQKNVGQVQVTVVSPKPVTRGQALALIYDALLAQGIYVIEMDNQLRVVKAEDIKNMQFQSLEEGANIQTMPDSNRVVQKVYKVKNISADSLKQNLAKFVPESSMTFDPATNTLILVDQLTRLKRYDRIIQALDQPADGDRVVEFFQLHHTDAPALADVILAAIVQEEGAGQGAGGRSGQPAARSPSNTRPSAGQYQVGEIAIVPDARLNLLIVSCPKAKLADLARLIEQLDVVQPLNVELRMIQIKFVDTNSLASRLSQLFPRNTRQAEKEQVQIVAYPDSDRLLVRSSTENFELIKKLVAEIDTQDFEKSDTRTYEIKYLQAADLATQLNNLFEQTSNTSYSSGDYSYSYRSTYRREGQPVFVPIARNNTLVVMANAKAFEFIEKMIKELDKEVNLTTFEPRIFQIRNTDANELVKIMETLFTGRSSSSATQFYNPYANRSGSGQQDAIKDLFGDIRFVVDTITNRVVVLTSHPENYPIVAKMIEQIDRFDPETSTVLTYELKYADAYDVADHLNNLFSEGAVQRPNVPQPNRQGANNNPNSGAADDQQNIDQEPERQIIYPWQSGGQQQRTGQTAERPINTMIGNVRVVPDERSSKLIVASPSIYFETLRNLVEQLDQPAPQVNIHTQVLEVTRGAERRIGVRWTPDPTTIQPAELDNAFVGLGQLGFLGAFGNRDTGPSNVSTGAPFGGLTRTLSSQTGAGNTVLGANVNLALLVQLLLKNTNSQVLSDPSITVNNNQRGIVFVGNKFPFRQGSTDFNTGTSSNQIQYQKIGVNMGIKPQINADGKIVMTISLENSSIADERVGGDLVTNLTQLNTQVAVDSGETLVIGGILIKNENQNNRQTPFLGRIPIVGWLFKKQDGAQSVRELLVFVTPDVLRTRQDDEALLKQARDRMDEIEGANAGSVKP